MRAICNSILIIFKLANISKYIVNKIKLGNVNVRTRIKIKEPNSG